MKTLKALFFLLLLVFYSCQENLTDETKDSKGKIIIGESHSIASKILNQDRELFVALPLNYNRNIHSYPVVIVMDAEYLFEITSAIVKIKTSRNEMPESIIVGIPNTKGSRPDMALELTKNDGQKFFGDHGGKAKLYLDFLRKEVYPFIENKYRANSNKTIIGMSPSFGPVLEAFWSEPDLFTNYIVLAAELSLKTSSGETVAQKLLTSVQDSLHPKTSIYIGKAGEDLKRRPPEETQAFIDLNRKLDSIANPKIKYKVEVLEGENHYGMSVSGIQNGLETIYPTSVWNVPYSDFWKSENPAAELKSYYTNLSKLYGFKIVPLEDSFYASHTILGTLRRLERQGRKKELKEFLKLALEYYPNSKELNNFISKEN